MQICLNFGDHYTETGKELHQLGDASNNTWSAIYSPDGNLIVSRDRGNDNSIKIWNTDTRELMILLKGHTDWVTAASFSPDGKKIVSASRDKTIKLWDKKTGQCVTTLGGIHENIYHASFSPDGNSIVSATWDSIYIWDVNTTKCIQRYNINTEQINSINYSPNGKYILIASSDNTCRVLSLHEEQSLLTLNHHNGGVTSVRYSRSGNQLVSTSQMDSIILIWDAETGEITHRLVGFPEEARTACFSPDEKYIVSSSDMHWNIKKWCLGTETQVWEQETNLFGERFIVYNPNGETIYSAGLGGEINVWNNKDGTLIESLDEHDATAQSVSISKSGKYLVSASHDNSIIIWDAHSFQLLKKMEGHTAGVNYAEFDPSEENVASASSDNTIIVWNAKTGQMIKQIYISPSKVNSVKYSPNGKYLVSASNDKIVRVWNVKTGELIRKYEGHKDGVVFSEFSPNGRKIVSASKDGTIRIWDFPPLQELIDSTRARFKDRQLTPDERRQYYLE